jgi:hypothetical protein
MFLGDNPFLPMVFLLLTPKLPATAKGSKGKPEMAKATTALKQDQHCGDVVVKRRNVKTTVLDV